MAKTPLFQGSCTAIVTPYTERGVDYERLKKNLDYQYESGTAAVVVCGTTGEAATQSVDEHNELVRFTVQTVGGRMKVVAGVGSNNTQTALRKLDYRIVHYESPDHRGIDCALLCRSSTLPLRGSAPKHVPDSAGGVMATRDILLAEFDSLAILVNHHPSQIGGKDERRAAARARLQALTDSLHAAGTARTLAVGDFNQDLWPGAPRGTLKYDGHWEKIDGAFAEGFSAVREEVFDDPLLLVPDSAFGGLKPRRTFVGPRYQGGVSDHLPVVFIVYF